MSGSWDKALAFVSERHHGIDAHGSPGHTDAELAEIKKRIKDTLPPFNADTSSGLVPNIITGRIANRLDLMGPNYLIDAACASSARATAIWPWPAA